MPLEAEALISGGAQNEAIELVERFGEKIRENPRDEIIYRRALAVLAHSRNETTREIAELENAAHHAQQLELDGAQWQILAELGTLYSVQGGEERAAGLAHRAYEIVQRLASTLNQESLPRQFLERAMEKISE